MIFYCFILRFILGSVYNDFDNDPLRLLDPKDFENFDIIEGTDTVNCSSDIEDNVEVEQSAIDTLFLQADDDELDRWSFDSELFDNTSDKSSCTYMRKVYELINNWDEQDVYDEHVKR